MIQVQKTDWDLSPLLKNESEIEPKLEKIKNANLAFTKKWKSRGDYLSSPSVLKEALDELERLNAEHGLSGDVGFYFQLKFELDQANSELKARLNKIEEFQKEIANEIRFFKLNLAKIPEEKQKEFLSSPELKNYKHFLELIFKESAHILSESEEKIISLKSSSAHDSWERMTQGLITKQEREITINGKKEAKNFSQLLSLSQDKDKKKRDSAAKALNEIFSQYSEVAEAEMNAIMANKKIDDELRKFPRPDSSRHLEDDISTETVDSLIKAVTEKFSIPKKFYELKAKLFKVPKIKYYERAVPYGEEKTLYPYEDSINLVHKTFQNLDKKFADILEMYVKNAQIDAFPKKGKRNGAFCSSYLKRQPTYILLNHDESLNDVTIIAHEVGHGINAELMKETQNSLNLGTPKSTAEVASTFMEDFVLDELLKESDDEKKLTILMEKLSGDISSIFRQTAFYNFEFELHSKFREKGYLSEKEIGEVFRKHMDSYMGESVDTSEAENWWIYVPHFRYFFYVYSYSSGLLISKALQRETKKNPKFIEKVKFFLSAGTSDSPENIFKQIGIDIRNENFWLEGLREIENLLETAENLAKKLKKL